MDNLAGKLQRTNHTSTPPPVCAHLYPQKRTDSYRLFTCRLPQKLPFPQVFQLNGRPHTTTATACCCCFCMHVWLCTASCSPTYCYWLLWLMSERCAGAVTACWPGICSCQAHSAPPRMLNIVCCGMTGCSWDASLPGCSCKRLHRLHPLCPPPKLHHTLTDCGRAANTTTTTYQ